MEFIKFSEKVKNDFILPDDLSQKNQNDLAKYYFNLKQNLNDNLDEEKDKKTKKKKQPKQGVMEKEEEEEKKKEEKEGGVFKIKIGISDSSSKSELSSTDKENKIEATYKDKTVTIPKNIKFGTHSNSSLYESLARELVFQIFHYPEMAFFKYKIDLSKNSISDNISIWLEGKNKENENYYLIDFLNYCVNNKNTKDSSLSNNIGEIINNNQNIKCNISDEITNIINNNPANIIIEKKKNDKINLTGDFDFIIPNINNKLLLEIFNDKKIAPFIFYGNIDIDKDQDFDIIGEIKESAENHRSFKHQIQKYILMISHFLDSKTDSYQEKFLHFNYKRKKILFYVFNGEYQNFLRIMTTFKINREKFKNLNEYKNDDYYKGIINKFNNEQDNKTHFLHLIIYSGLAFIFLYIPDILSINYQKIIDSNKFEKAISNLEEKLNKQTEKYNEQNKKYNEQTEKLNKQTEKLNKQTEENKKITEKYNKLSKEFNKYKEDNNEIIKKLFNEINQLKKNSGYNNISNSENPDNNNISNLNIYSENLNAPSENTNINNFNNNISNEFKENNNK